MHLARFNRKTPFSVSTKNNVARTGSTIALAILCFVMVFASSSTAQNINTVAGGSTPSNVATSLDLPGITSAIEDPTGKFLYVASPDSYYIFEVTLSTGAATVIAGGGIQGYSGDGGPATSATLSGPNSLVLDPSGNLYFIDLNKIREINTSGTISTFAGNGQLCSGAKNACGDGGPAISAQFNMPQQIAFDPSGNMYVADMNDQRIRVINTSGTISTFAGTGRICDGPHFTCGDGGPASQSFLDLPAGVVADTNGNVYIADTRDQRVRVVNNGTITTVIGSGTHCTVPTKNCGDGGPAIKANLFNPWGLALDSNQNIYIADQLDNRIRKVTISTMIINTVAGSGVQGYSGDGGAPKLAALDQPNGIFINNLGYIVVSDTGNGRVRISSKGAINTYAGGSTGGDGGGPLTATLGNPTNVAWDSVGNYYIVDTANNRIREVDTTTNIITTIAGNGSAGWSGDSGPATQAMLNSPTGIAFDGAGNLYIADNGNLRVRMVNTSGTITTVAGSGNPCILSSNACGDGGSALLANITSPTSIALDGSGNLYIADYYDQKIRMVSPSGTITTVAGMGGKGFTGDSGPATKARLDRPYGVAVDANGNIYIADSQNNRIRCVIGAKNGCNAPKLKVGDITTFAFNGQPTFAGDGGTAKSASQQDPLEVALDPSGNLFVSGGADEVVRRIDGTTFIVSTVAGNPNHPLRGGFGGDGGPATSATLDNVGLAVNGSESLLIADTGNNRVRQVNLSSK